MNLDFQVEQRNLDRAAAIRAKEERPRSVIRQRLAEGAEQLNRAGTMQAHLTVCLEAVAALVSILYQLDEDGQPANYDRATGRILIPVPWSDGGSRRWGLRQWEARCLRALLRDRLTQQRRLSPLFDYSDITGRWYVDLDIYPTINHAVIWLRKDAPSLAEWRSTVETYRERAADRMTKSRSNRRKTAR